MISREGCWIEKSSLFGAWGINHHHHHHLKENQCMSLLEPGAWSLISAQVLGLPCRPCPARLPPVFPNVSKYLASYLGIKYLSPPACTQSMTFCWILYTRYLSGDMGYGHSMVRLGFCSKVARAQPSQIPGRYLRYLIYLQSTS